MSAPLDLPIDLPAGLTARPLVMSDARAVFEVMAAQELHDTGEVAIEEADIVADWQRPSYDLAGQSIGVLDGDRLLGYAEVIGADRGDAAVHPDHRGRGIGTAGTAAVVEYARTAIAPVVSLYVNDFNAPARATYRRVGFDQRGTFMSVLF